MDTRLATCNSHAGGHPYILKPFFRWWNVESLPHLSVCSRLSCSSPFKWQISENLFTQCRHISIHVSSTFKVLLPGSIFLTSLHCLESKYLNLIIPQQGYVVICDVHWIYSQNVTPRKTRHERSDGLFSKSSSSSGATTSIFERFAPLNI